jgi:LysR family glycine cleavage system transcriptional activator
MQALRAFEAAAREKSLTRAAQALHVTHGAISHQIKALEADLGVPLTERAGRGIRLTDEGERFASRVRAAFAELTAAVHEVTARANPAVAGQRRALVRRPLVVAADRGFLAACPEVDLDVRSNISNIDFARDDADVAIRYGHGDWPAVTAEHLLDDRFFPVCSPRILGGRVPLEPEDLARYTLLRTNDEPWKPWFDAAGLDWPEPSRGPIFNDSTHMLQAAAEGQGVALARASLLGNDIRNGVLVGSSMSWRRHRASSGSSIRRAWPIHPSCDLPQVASRRDWRGADRRALVDDRLHLNADRSGLMTGTPRLLPTRVDGRSASQLSRYSHRIAKYQSIYVL